MNDLRRWQLNNAMARTFSVAQRYDDVPAEQLMPRTVMRWEYLRGAWHHIAITYDGKGGVWLAIDGVLVDG